MIIKYNKKYDDEIKNLLVELQEYIVSIDEEKYNVITPEYKEKYFAKTLEDVNKYQGIILLAKENQQIVGLIIGLINNEECSEFDFKEPKRGRISEFVISRKSRKQGIGKKLLDAMEQHFKEVGCEDVLIGVFGYNKLALNFYNENGYHNRMLELTKKIIISNEK